MSVLIPLVESLSNALTAQDEAAFQALCTAAGWASRGDSAQRLWAQGNRRQWSLVRTGALPRGGDGRGAIAVEVHAPERGRLSIVHLLFVTEDDAWKLEGVSSSNTIVNAFIEGKVPALFNLEGLPAHPELEDWAKHAAASALDATFGKAQNAGLFLDRASLPAVTPTLIESRYLEASGRGLVVFEMVEEGNDFPDQFTVVADHGPEGWTALDVGTYPSAEMLLPEAASST